MSDYVKSRARFTVPEFTADQMRGFGNALVQSVKARLARAQDIYDQPAPSLKPAYAKQKARRYPPAIRNWKRTGDTLESLEVRSATPNRVVVGFNSDLAKRRAFLNNRRSRQFGASPRDMEAVRRAIENARSVRKAA